MHPGLGGYGLYTSVDRWGNAALTLFSKQQGQVPEDWRRTANDVCYSMGREPESVTHSAGTDLGIIKGEAFTQYSVRGDGEVTRGFKGSVNVPLSAAGMGVARSVGAVLAGSSVAAFAGQDNPPAMGGNTTITCGARKVYMN